MFQKYFLNVWMGVYRDFLIDSYLLPMQLNSSNYHIFLKRFCFNYCKMFQMLLGIKCDSNMIVSPAITWWLLWREDDGLSMVDQFSGQYSHQIYSELTTTYKGIWRYLFTRLQLTQLRNLLLDYKLWFQTYTKSLAYLEQFTNHFFNATKYVLIFMIDILTHLL